MTQHARPNIRIVREQANIVTRGVKGYANPVVLGRLYKSRKLPLGNVIDVKATYVQVKLDVVKSKSGRGMDCIDKGLFIHGMQTDPHSLSPGKDCNRRCLHVR